MTRARALDLYVGRGDSPAAVARNYCAAMERARTGFERVVAMMSRPDRFAELTQRVRR